MPTGKARGQVTFKKAVLQHLGIKHGNGMIELDLLPDGRAIIKAAQTSGSINDFIGLLQKKTNKIASIDEINEARISSISICYE